MRRRPALAALIALALAGPPAPGRAEGGDGPLPGWGVRPRTPLGIPISPNVDVGAAARTTRSRGDVQTLYRAVAPATVIIRTANGHGTGVLISGGGRVLTNHHVAVDGVREAGKVTVDVELGKLSPDGRMVRTGKPLRAHVLKWDRKLDLALLQIDAPPSDLRWVKLAAKPASPGQSVAILGHGSIGLLWAIRDCEVEGVGHLYDSLTRQVIQPLDGQQTSTAPEPRARRANPASVIQTSCRISPGDSGGPVVNRSGELVGLNDFLLEDKKAPVTTSFHVDGREIAGFLKKVPRSPPALFPEPWDAGEGGALRDFDGDGRAETLLLSSPDAQAVLFDLTPPGKAPASRKRSVEEILDSRSYKAQVVIYWDATGVYAWYDTLGVGRPDRLYVADRKGSVQDGFALRSGKATRIHAGSLPKSVVTPSLLSDATMQVRLETLARAILPEEWLPEEHPGPWELPDPIPEHLENVSVIDLDGDGAPETLSWSSPEGLGVVSSLGKGLPAGTSPDELASHLRGSARVAFVKGTFGDLTTFYSSSPGAGLDRALWSGPDDPGIAIRSFAISDGTGVDVPGQQGRLIVRPGLLSLTEEEFRRLALLATRIGADAFTARDDRGLGSFPPVMGKGWNPPIALRGQDFDGTALALATNGADSIVVDFSGRAGELSEVALSAAIASGSLPVSFVFHQRGPREYVLYDRDGNGRLDLVLFSADPDTGKADAAYSIEADGSVVTVPDMVGGPLFRPSVYATPALRESARRLIDALHVPEKAMEP